MTKFEKTVSDFIKAQSEFNSSVLNLLMTIAKVMPFNEKSDLEKGLLDEHDMDESTLPDDDEDKYKDDPEIGGHVEEIPDVVMGDDGEVLGGDVDPL